MGSESYAELHCHSQFSFLDGASTPEALAAEAMRLELSALALTDHDAALHLDLAHALAHGLHGSGVSLVFLAQACEFGGGDGGLLNDLKNFLDEGAIHVDPAGEWASVMASAWRNTR